MTLLELREAMRDLGSEYANFEWRLSDQGLLVKALGEQDQSTLIGWPDLSARPQAAIAQAQAWLRHAFDR